MKRRLLAALLVLVTPLAAAQVNGPSQAALEAIDACVARLDPEIDIGYERIVARCPDLAAHLERSGWSAWLPPSWKDPRNDLSAGGLRELRAVVARELATRAAERAPRVEPLNEILAGLGNNARERTGFWVRFKAWLRSLFERRVESDDMSWLARLIDRVGISQTMIEVITYITLGLIVVLAAVIISNELRAAGLFGRRRVRAGSGAAPGAATTRRLTWRDVESADLADKPRLLLELIALKLTDLKRLPPSAALTARELARAAQLQEASDRSRLVELATTAERVRYSDDAVEPARVQAAIEHGRELLAHIEAPAAPRGRA